MHTETFSREKKKNTRIIKKSSERKDPNELKGFRVIPEKGEKAKRHKQALCRKKEA